MKKLCAAIFFIIPVLANSQLQEERKFLKEENQLKALTEKSPQVFRENKGQLNPEVRFEYKNGTQLIQFLDDRIAFSTTEYEFNAALHDSAERFRKGETEIWPRSKLRVKHTVWNLLFINSKKSSELHGEYASKTYTNYIRKSYSATYVRDYSRLRYKNIYEGIDIVFFISNGELKYDIELAANADISQVRFAFEGIKKLELDKELLLINTNQDILKESIPLSYSVRNGKRVKEAVSYTLLSDKTLGFKYVNSASSRCSYPVTIDPLRWTAGTYFGDTVLGAITDITGISVDSAGNVYAAGQVAIAYYGIGVNNFPTTPGVYDSTISANYDGFVSKFSADLSELLYSTIIGGIDADYCDGIKVDKNGLVYITGSTASFSSIQEEYPYQSMIGPTLTGPGQGTAAFITKFNSNGSALIYSTVLTSSGFFRCSAIDINYLGEAFVCGTLYGSGLIITANAFKTSASGGLFLSKLSADGNDLLYSTYLTNNYSSVLGSQIRVLERDLVYVMSFNPYSDWPTTANAHQKSGKQNFLKIDVSASPMNQVKYGSSFGTYLTEFSGYFTLINQNEVLFAYSTPDTSLKKALNKANGSYDIVLGKLNLLKDSLNSFEKCRYIGGAGDELVRGIILNSRHQIYILYGGLSAYRMKFSSQSGFAYGDYDLKLMKLDTCLNPLDSFSIGGDWDDIGRPEVFRNTSNLHLYERGDRIIMNARVRSSSQNLPVSENAYQKVLPNKELFHSLRDTISVIGSGYTYSALYQFEDSLTISDKPALDLGKDTSICKGTSISLNAGKWKNIQWNNSSRDSSAIFQMSDSGKVTLLVHNSGCMALRDTIRITYKQLNFKLKAPGLTCNDSVFKLDAGISGLKYKWSTADTNQMISADTGGIYWVDVTNVCETKRDSAIVKQVFTPAKQLGSDTVFCKDFSFLISAKDSGLKYIWNSIDSTRSILVDTAGLYILSASNVCGKISDSILITQYAAPVLSLPKDTIICDSVNLQISVASPQLPYSRIRWNGSTTDTLPGFQIKHFGTVSVNVSNYCGTSIGLYKVTKDSLPVFELGNDSIFCDQISISLNAYAANADSFLWSNGSRAASIQPLNPGSYKVSAFNRCGVKSDSIKLGLQFTPFVELGYDTVYCGKVSHQLNAYSPTAKYLWNTGDTSSILKINKAGLYQVLLNNYCGTAKDEISIGSSPDPKVNLGRDTIICTELKYLLDAGDQGSSYHWKPAISSSRFLEANEYGVYKVKVINQYLCSSEDSVLISDKCPPQVFIPKAFTPNGVGDERNEKFHIQSRFLERMHLTVYNRWGELVYESMDPNAGWDGTLQGKPCQEGIYYYLISIAGNNYEQNLNGYFLLLR